MAAARASFSKLTSMLGPRTQHRRSEESDRPLHSDRRAGGSALRQSDRGARRRRSVRRDDLHELLPALGDGARRRPIASCWKCCATCSTSCRSNKTFRAQLERNYRAARARRPPAQRADLRLAHARSSSSTCATGSNWSASRPGEVICRQGDAADSFYLVRIGFVKVTEAASRRRAGARLSRPRRILRRDRAARRRASRTATCTALDHVEVVRISARGFPPDAGAVSRRSRQPAKRSRESASRRTADACRASCSTVPIDQFLAKGLMEAQSLLVLDLEKCTRCDQCVRACADAHDGVTRLVREGLRFDKYLVATSCRPVPRSAVHGRLPGRARSAAGTRWRSSSKTGASAAACARKNCPYGNINMHPFAVNVDDPAHPGRKIASDARRRRLLRPVHGARGAELRLRLSARCGAPRGSAEFFAGLLKQSSPPREVAPC